jgi:hypothetical protein
MSDLSPECRALVDAARGARLGANDRARIRARLGERIALTAVAGAAAATVAASTSAGTSIAPASAAGAAKLGGVGLVGKVFLACVLLGSASLGVRAVLTSPTWGRTRVVSAPPAATAASDPASTDAFSSGEPSEPSPQEAALPSPTASVAPQDAPLAAPPRAKPLHSGAPSAKADAASIAAELALMRRAQSALATGDSARSLEALDALSARHPDGALREERDAARVLALCSAGRIDEARAQAQRFLAQTPNSVQAARVRASCAFASPTKK